MPPRTQTRRSIDGWGTFRATFPAERKIPVPIIDPATKNVQSGRPRTRTRLVFFPPVSALIGAASVTGRPELISGHGRAARAPPLRSPPRGTREELPRGLWA